MTDFVDFVVRFCLFAALHSLFAADWAKRFFNRADRIEPRYYRLGYNLVALATLAWVMAAYRSSRVLYFAPGIWSLVLYGAQLCIAGILVHCVCQTDAGEFLGIRQIRSGYPTHSKLVTTGYYAHMRHPLYFFSLLFMALTPVMTMQWLLATGLSLVYFVVGGMIEEHRLIKTFGSEYLDYQQRTPFLIPIPKRPKDATA